MSWKKVKLGDLLTESKIISEKPNPDRRITVRLKVLGVEKRGLENEVEGATKQYIRKAGQFIYGKQNFHKGAFGIVPSELDGFESSSDLPSFDIDKSCLPEFIFYFFKQGNFYLELSKIASGVATQRINTTQLFELELLLPDIKTQKQLISNIQILEKNGAEISTELTHQIALVKKLRQQLLQDAVQGKLVAPSPLERAGGEAFEPASELLKKIKNEKEKLIAEKNPSTSLRARKEKELPTIKPEEIPFEIPENWVWCRLGDLCIELLGGYAFDSSRYSKTETQNQVIRLGNVKPNQLVLETTPVFIDDDYAKEALRASLFEGDILITMTGTRAKKDYLFSLCLTESDFQTKNLYLNQRVGCFRFGLFIVNNYINIALKDVRLLNAVFESSTGAANQANIGIAALKDILIPLPPLAEQNRIVQKLDELMQYCNELEASIKQSESKNEKLLQQVLREALRKEPVEV
jgi:type I restriction enzyme S subunit